ncbi:MAG: hypothetical protein QGG64_00795 [Candidatus Latescibacteria bacterium]|jgi:hypothetical protein|nr:hypothetical protein [Candidatus Latescibacterota bacterium]
MPLAARSKGYAVPKVADPDKLAPCEKQCWYWWHCKRFHLACPRFYLFWFWGHDLDPPPPGWMHKDAPNRKRYRRQFPEEFE